MASGHSSESEPKAGENPSLHLDQREIILSFLEEPVRFLVVGGHAFSAHAFTRATKDIDLWIDPSLENARAVYSALAKYGAPLNDHGVTADDFAVVGSFYQLGLPPARVDVLTELGNISFDDAWGRRLETSLDGIHVPVIHLDDLIQAKRAADRPQDRVDLEALQRVKRRLEKEND